MYAIQAVFFHQIFIIFDQIVCLDEISVGILYGSSGGQKLGHRSNLRKPCVCDRGCILLPIFIIFGLIFCLDKT